MEMSASFSVGAVAYRHDIREGELPKNVDPSLTKYNITFVDKLQGRSVEQYTNERMQGAVDEYNAKQKRADRKVKNYVDWHRKNGPRNRETSERTPLMYEAVFQIGEHENLGKMWYECNHSMAFRKFMQRECEAILNEIQTKYPHLEIVWATLHMDEPEGTPHLHIAYQPVGDRYKQGLSERVCLGNALACDGIERIKDRGQADEEGFQQRRFYNRMEDYVKSRLKTDELKHWTQEEITIKERVSGRKHLDPKVYKERKAAEDEKKRLEAENIALKTKNAELHADLDSLFDQLADVKEKVLALQSWQVDMRAEIDDLQQEKVALDAENRSITKENTALLAENTMLKAQNSEVNNAIMPLANTLTRQIERLGIIVCRVKNETINQLLNTKLGKYAAIALGAIASIQQSISGKQPISTDDIRALKAVQRGLDELQDEIDEYSRD